ncbi:MAG: DJ-1/PfpI family protein [Rikenellaceae bacterium]|nr:DJ-1/PfpI family protein [Rikenellaceae bacterium]
MKRKKVAVIAVDPVNGSGLLQYLEAFGENTIPFDVFAVAERRDIMTNSGIALSLDSTIAELKGREAEYDALVFACGDAMPRFVENAQKQYNIDMMEVILSFAAHGKTIAGHCAAALLLDQLGIVVGKRVAVHPFVRPIIRGGIVVDGPCAVAGNIFTASSENNIAAMLPRLLEALR